VANIPTIDRSMPGRTLAPVVSYSATAPVARNAGEPIANLGKVLSGIQNTIENRKDLRVAVDSKRAGQMAGQNGIPALMDETTIRGENFNQAAREGVAVQYSLKSRQALRDYEEQHAMDPVGFKGKATAFIGGFLPKLQEFDPAMAQKFEGDFSLEVDAAAARISERHIAAVRAQQVEESLALKLQYEDDIALQAQTLFQGKPEDTAKTLAALTGNGAQLIQLVNRVGADGKPIFDVHDRVGAQNNVEELVSKNVGLSWLRAQPDMLAAYDAWKKGDAAFDAAGPDGTTQRIKLKDVLGPRGYRQAEESFFGQLKSDLAIQSQVDTARDRAFNDNSDALFSDLSVIAQENQLPLSIVDASKASLAPEKYLALRAMARSGGATVTDGGTLARLSVDDVNGSDIRSQLTSAYENGKLTTDDYTKLYERNTQRLAKGIDTPVSTGRDFVSNSLGKLSTELGFAQSVAIPKADAEYATRVDDFIKKNERQPTTTEALEIGQDVVRRYSALDVNTAIANMPLPIGMSPSEKFSGNLNLARIQDAARQTRTQFLKKYNGNVEAMESDERYIEEGKLLQQYVDLIQRRDAERVQKDASKP
jgi:hypothetical protein